MLVKYVGDKSMLVKTFLYVTYNIQYVDEIINILFHTYSPTYIFQQHPSPTLKQFFCDRLYSVGVSIVQGFVFNKMELEGVVMLVFIIVSVLLLIIPSIMISRQPQSSAALSFSVSYTNDYGIWKYLGRIQRIFRLRISAILVEKSRK